MTIWSRYIRHPAPGTTGPTGLVASDNPMGSGRNTLLLNNIRHLNSVNAIRALWTSPGVEGFYRAAGGGTGYTSAPSPQMIDWRYTRKTGGCSLYLGRHYAWKDPRGRWPRVSCRFAVKVASTYTAGLVLVIVRGDGSVMGATEYSGAAYTDTSFTEHELYVDLTDASTARVAYTPANGTSAAAIDENGELLEFSTYLGGYCSSNGSGDPASVVGVTLTLESAP